MQGRRTYQEKLFINFQLSEQIPADNIYRLINESIDFRFLYKATAQYYGTEGQKSIDPVVFMKLILAGYLENLNSDRRIINALRLRLDIRYFIGYNLDEELPWHGTLGRTRELYGEQVFIELFKRVLKQCIDKRMVSGRRQAVDSVFIKANASIDSMLAKDILADAENYSEELKANEDEGAVIKMVAEDKSGDGESEKKAKLTNATHYSPTDPDARLSTKPRKPTNLNYLGQVSVDTSSHVITCVKAFLADKRDSQCLPPFLVHLISNLKENGLEIEELIADTNYSSGTSLRTLEAAGIAGYIPNTGRFEYEKEGFVYHAEGDYYGCKNGKVLIFSGFSENDKRYRISAKHCQGCPFKDSCIGNKKYMAVKVTIDKPYYDRMHIRMQSKYAARQMKIRQSTAEPVIGTLVEYLGIKKVNSRGLSQANKCLTMAAVAYNIKKLIKYKPKSLSIDLQKTNNQVYKPQKSLFSAFYSLLFENRIFQLPGLNSLSMK